MNRTVPTTPNINDQILVVSWEPFAPIGLTEVVLDPDPGLDHAALLELLAQCIERLQAYHAGYLEAMAQDTQPAMYAAIR